MLFFYILLFILETVQFSTRLVFVVINFMVVPELIEGGGGRLISSCMVATVFHM